MNKLLVLFLAVFIVGCNKFSACRSDEVSRVSSPEHLVDAVITKSNCGATTDFSYRIFIVPIGNKIEGQQVFLADKTEGLQIQWRSANNLDITFDKARIFEFTNFWQSKDVKNFTYIVDIDLKQK